MDEDQPATGRGRNPFVVALWVLSGVSIGIGPVGIVAAQNYLSSPNGYSYTGAPPLVFLLAQASAYLAPSVMTGGLVLAGIALAVSALHRYGFAGQTRGVPGRDAGVDLPADGVSTGSTSGVGGPTSGTASSTNETARPANGVPDYRRPTTDHQQYMRPSTRSD